MTVQATQTATSQATGERVTRLAPSPTGALHLGNARTFLITWAMARQAGWRLLLRIEDIDTPRIKAESVPQTIDTLRWLGMDWDGDYTTQAADVSRFQAALADLQQRGLVYPCSCTRTEIQHAQSAPHEEDRELRYPGTCRPRDGARRFDAAANGDESERSVAWRLLVPDEPVEFEDRVFGRQRMDVQRDAGDFVVATKAGLPAYQLAVVVDDARQGVTDVIRGDDLLCSTARQIWLYRLLELGPPPRYTHLPLVVGPDGRRLAKRHGDTRVATYQQQGVPPERIIGLIAYWSGVSDRRESVTAAEFAQRFTLDRLSRERVIFTAEDDAWLRR